MDNSYESRRYRGRKLNEDFGEDEYERLRNTLENKLGVTFYSDPGSMDDIAEFVDTYGGSADVCFGEDKNDRFLIELGYTCSEDGELNIWYSVYGPEKDYRNEPDEQGLTDWKEVSDKIIRKVNGLKESRRVFGRPLFEDIEVAEPQENPFKVGDILAGTWGYSMIIPMFVQVIGVTPKSVRCRQLRVLNDNGFQGHDAMARKDDFEPESRNFPNTFLARVKGKPGEEYVMCPSPRCYLRPWDGRGLSYDHMD
jgi:hypothetical protein